MSPPPARARARAAWSRLPPVRKTAHTILLLIAHRSEMSTARVTLKFGEIPFEAFFAGAANVIFRHASTGVWVKEVREYASTRVREKSWWTLFGLTTKAGNISDRRVVKSSQYCSSCSESTTVNHSQPKPQSTLPLKWTTVVNSSYTAVMLA